jgi:hypothetical protein
MKKFHGKRVPRPRTKKMIHTALYLENENTNWLTQRNERRHQYHPCLLQMRGLNAVLIHT